MIITGEQRDLGGFTVRRILPYATHCMIGPFIFFDHMGPAIFDKGKGLDVRPHPHINLATVTYLFEGQICHRDSLGSVQLIEPGAINWMIAGHGIVHSERTPQDLRNEVCRLGGIQCWLALPEEHEEMQPVFEHYPAATLPEFRLNEVNLKLLLGNAFNYESPVSVKSDLFYLHTHFPAGSQLNFTEKREIAIYTVSGKIKVNNKVVQPYSMYLGLDEEDFSIESLEDSEVMLLGGESLGERFIYWNFVSSSTDKIEKAKMDWLEGPGELGTRFPKIPDDQHEFIPLPEEIHDSNPKGTIM